MSPSGVPEMMKEQTFCDARRNCCSKKEMLLKEIQHRVANSLQIIAGILMMKARSVTSEETRQHLQDAQLRVISVATVQQHLKSAGKDDVIAVGPYLTKLCKSLADSMIADDRAISLEVISDDGLVISSQAVSLGLIVMELLINALKHAFPKDHLNAKVIIRYETYGANWRLTVSDNGVGKTIEPTTAANAKGGLGTSLVKALAQQLEAQVETVSSGRVRVLQLHERQPCPPMTKAHYKILDFARGTKRIVYSDMISTCVFLRSFVAGGGAIAKNFKSWLRRRHLVR